MFKIGDRVVCINRSECRSIKNDKEYTVTGVYNKLISVNDIFTPSGLHRSYYMGNRFKLIVPVDISKSPFYIGEVVECVYGCENTKVGSLYTVQKIVDNFSLQVQEYPIRTYNNLRFKKINKEKEITVMNKFNVGDRVRCIPDKHGNINNADINTILQLDGDAFFLEGNSQRCESLYFTLVKEPADKKFLVIKNNASEAMDIVSSLERAEELANDLAIRYRGKYDVYQLISDFKPQPTSVIKTTY